MSTEKTREEIDEAQRRDQQRREAAMDKRDAETTSNKPVPAEDHKEDPK